MQRTHACHFISDGCLQMHIIGYAEFKYLIIISIRVKSTLLNEKENKKTLM